MNLPKLKIVKKFVLNSQGHYRYYSPYYNPDTKEKVYAPKLDLNRTPIQTEKELCYILYKNFGPGEYRVIAWKIGRKGCWTFWKGEINDEGFVMFVKKSNTLKNIEKLKKKIAMASDEDEKDGYKEEIDLEREFKDYQEPENYGFTPFLKASGKRGIFVRWEDEVLVPKISFDSWESNDDKVAIKVTKGQTDDWGITKKGRKEIKEEFEKWD